MGNGRLDKQREYQRRYRERKKRNREPDRDEIARELLHFAITENLRRGREAELWRIADTVIDRLAARGFDADATARVLDEIVDRYQSGWSFQRKVHLQQRPDEAEAAEEGDGR